MGEDRAAALEAYVHEHIPVTAANRFRLVSLNEGIVTVAGRYRDHVNHRDSVFGGSISSALTLSGWAQVREWCPVAGATIVIQRQTTEYLEPVLEDFVARGLPFDEREAARAASLLAKFGKCRLSLDAELLVPGDPSPKARFSGTFVVVDTSHQSQGEKSATI